jgi:protein-tyrosine phosphatase
MPEQRLYRGGLLLPDTTPANFGNIATIINLRASPDPTVFTGDYLHLPMQDTADVYHTEQPKVRQWLAKLLRHFENPQLRYPVLIHCFAGRDRTGVAVAALLLILGIAPEMIVEEYLLSDGTVQAPLIHQALAGIADAERYFAGRVDVVAVRKAFLA